MFSPAFRLALERTLNDDITPEALESVFRISMRKMTDAKKCRTGINLSKNLLIAKIIHKTRNIIIAAKKDQESTSLTSSVVTNLSPVLKVPCASPSPKLPQTDKSPLNETQPEPSSRTSTTSVTVSSSIRLKFQPSESESQAPDENVAPITIEDDTHRSHVSSPRPAKRPHGWCCGNPENSSSWTTSQPPIKVVRMDVDDSRESEAAQSPPISTSVTVPAAFASVTSPSGHVFHHQPHSPPPTNTTGLWSFCAKEQPNPSPVVPAIYSPYHQRLSMPLTTCPMRLSLAST